MRSQVSYRFQNVWTGENDSKTLRMDANFFEIGEELRFQTNTDTCGKDLKRITILLRIINI